MTKALLGPRWASLCGAQTAQGLLCEARKFFSSNRTTLRTPGDPVWYLHVLGRFCQRHQLPLKVHSGQSLVYTLPDVLPTMDTGALDQLLDLYQALVWRFCTTFCTGVDDVPLGFLRPGAKDIFQTPHFHSRKLLQFNWRIDRTSLGLWDACNPHIGAQAAEWPHRAPVDDNGGEDGPDGPVASVVAVRNVVLTTAAHILLPCRQLPFLTPDTIARKLATALADGRPWRHPYGRAVDQAVKYTPKRERFQAVFRG